MLMPKKDRKKIYEYLFTEGVLVAKKDCSMTENPHIKVPNLYVIKALQSLKSRGYVTEKFAWQHFYWRLTNEGIQYLREYLHLPSDVVPATLKRPTFTRTAMPRGKPGSGPSGSGPRDEDRDAYRKAQDSGTTPWGEVPKPGGVGGDGFNPGFNSMGRGAGPYGGSYNK